jgi:hypothetical protein
MQSYGRVRTLSRYIGGCTGARHVLAVAASGARRLSAGSPTAFVIAPPPARPAVPPKHQLFNKLLAANRGEIAVRIFRAATELGVPSCGVYSFQDRFSPHRYKADESFMVGRGQTPVAAYLNIEEIVRTAKQVRRPQPS